MKFFALSAGKAFLALSIFISTASNATEYEYQPAFFHEYDWAEIGKWSGIAAISILGITQLDKSEIIFASLYGFSGIYYIHEKTSAEDRFEYEDYVVPAGFATLALTNLTLLQQDEESKSTIFFYNMLGTGLIGAYWYYFEGPGTKAFAMPWTDGENIGLAFHSEF